MTITVNSHVLLLNKKILNTLVFSISFYQHIILMIQGALLREIEDAFVFPYIK